MNITYLVSERSTCTRRRVGAVAVKDKRILATGYNGAPAGVPHCLEVGCLREQLGIPSGQRHEICRGLHAEQNVIIQAAVHGINIQGAELYCTTHPCVLCSKMLINCGIRRIYYAEDYPDDLATAMLREAGVMAFFSAHARGHSLGRTGPLEGLPQPHGGGGAVARRPGCGARLAP